MNKFTDVSTLWYDENEYESKNRLNFTAFKTGETQDVGGVQMKDSSKFFRTPKKVCEKIISENELKIEAEYDKGITVTERFEFFGNVIRQHNVVSNNGDDSISLCQLSSATVRISVVGLIDWMNKDRFTLYYCKSSWREEGQWKKVSFRELGMSGSKATIDSGFVDFQSKGSWSTGKYYPLIIIEDNENGRCYFFENECGSNWEIQINKPDDCLQVVVNTCDVNNDGWNLKLSPSEKYSTTTAVYGMVRGCFEDAVCELNKYKRATSLVKWDGNCAKLVYNNYMGGTFGNPDKRLIGLIDRAAECGCEVFCIDAGWYREAGTLGFCGDYYINDKRFEPYTLKDILVYIKQKGMLPGLWFEFEACTEECDGYKIKDAMLKRNGEILGGSRGFYDMTNENVKSHLMEAVDRAYGIGMRFIKNDYNNSTGIGVGDDNYNENAKVQMRAILEFVDEIKAKYPDIIIENCGSGGMRSDNFTLSHFEMQSTSDQENFVHNPSIIMGSLACMPVEKVGVWTYPYFGTGAPDSEEIKNRVCNNYQDGEKTIFNMVTGNMGAMYMSGRLDWADEHNMSLIKEGTALYKQNRSFLAKAYPIYPSGMKPVAESGFTALGLTNEENSEILLAVWKIEDNNDTYTVDLSKYISKKSKIELIYPRNDNVCRYNFSPQVGKLTVSLKGKDNMARLFKINNL